MIALVVSVGLVVAACLAWSRALERDAKLRRLVVIGRDELVPRAVAIPTVYRRSRKDVWP